MSAPLSCEVMLFVQHLVWYHDKEYIHPCSSLESVKVKAQSPLPVHGPGDYYSASTLSCHFIVNSRIEFAVCGGKNFSPAWHKKRSHGNFYVKPGATEGCWTC